MVSILFLLLVVLPAFIASWAIAIGLARLVYLTFKKGRS